MMQSSIIISTLFKTVEYKLVSSSNLELNSLSRSGSLNTKTISLNSINIEEGQSSPSYLPWTIVFLGCFTIALVVYASKSSSLIYSNLMSITSFLACIFGALAIFCKPITSQKYLDSFSNNILFEFNETSRRNKATNQFISNLNIAIKEAKQVELSRTSFTSNSQLQYELHRDNIDDLLNSGLINELLYDRICSSMQTNFYGAFAPGHQGSVNHQRNEANNNIIYLNL